MTFPLHVPSLCRCLRTGEAKALYILVSGHERNRAQVEMLARRSHVPSYPSAQAPNRAGRMARFLRGPRPAGRDGGQLVRAVPGSWSG